MEEKIAKREKKNVNSRLRKKAEKKANAGLPPTPVKLTAGTLLRLNHELQVHQIELEMQNDELRKAQTEIEKSRHKYSDLYDFAPVGYVTLDEKGVIEEINLTGAKMLGTDRTFLIGKPFITFLRRTDLKIFMDYLEKSFKTEEMTRVEMTLSPRGGILPVQMTSVPVRVEGKTPRLRAVISDITERKRAEDELQGLINYLDRLREDEWKKISTELHDEIGSSLGILSLDIAWLRKGLIHQDESVQKRLELMTNIVKEMGNGIRRFVSELRPVIIDDFGLAAAVESYLTRIQERTGIQIFLKMNSESINVNSDLSITIFRILQEAINNVIRHSRAKHVNVNIRQTREEIYVEISDDGIGLKRKGFKSSQNGGFGLIGMKERIKRFNGSISISDRSSGGTTVKVQIPIKQFVGKGK